LAAVPRADPRDRAGARAEWRYRLCCRHVGSGARRRGLLRLRGRHVDETLKLIEATQARLKLLEKRLKIETRIEGALRHRDRVEKLRADLDAVNEQLEELEQPTREPTRERG